MTSSISNHWWGFEDGKKKMHWRSWDWMTTPKNLGGMGFRDFVIFNQAMLGKQCWRMVTDPTSLCARVLKGRYFPDTDFLSANKPRSSSFTWRSILFGRELLMKGLRWGVGNGDKISVLRDNWIPGFKPGSFKPVEGITAGAKVRSLMDDAGTEWDMNKLSSLFPQPMVEAIQQIPISKQGGEDFASWPYAKLGMYTVRSAYNLARTEAFYCSRATGGRGGSSNGTDHAKDWKAIWAIQCPEKMKIVLWRMAHDCLPTGFQLQRRHIPATDECIFCGKTEHVEHIFLLCPFARAVWDIVKQQFSIILNRKALRSMQQWLFDFLRRSTDVQATVLAVTCWHIWEARNDARNDKGMLQVVRITDKIKVYTDSIILHCYKKRSATRCEPSSVRWIPPPADTICVNVDAAIFAEEQRMGWGAVFRDHEGSFLLAASEGLSGSPCPEMAEALAVRGALQVAAEKGFQYILLATDCLSMVQRILSPGRDRSAVGIVVEDIKILASRFISCTVKHYGRKLNVAAHKLARSCEHLVFHEFYVIPECIREVLCIDVP
jgi:ribonuclease HI